MKRRDPGWEFAAFRSELKVKERYNLDNEQSRATPDRWPELRERLRTAGCEYDFRHKRWRCPSCRIQSGLNVRTDHDGAFLLECVRRCPHFAILGAIGWTFVDAGPDAFVRGDTA